MLSSNTRIVDARRLVAAVEGAGATAPKVLTDLLAGFDLLGGTPAPGDHSSEIIESAAAGTLTPKDLDGLIAKAAQAQAAADYRARLRQRGEHLFVKRFHQALCDGAADEVLKAVRSGFNAAAKTLADAQLMVDINTDHQTLVETATPAQLDAWRSLRPAIAKLDAIGAIVREFSPRAGHFGIFDMPGLVEPASINDEAIFCADVELVKASKVFGVRRADPMTSPWLRTAPRLQSVAEAKERFRAWCEGEWEHLNGNYQTRGRLTDDGFKPEQRTNPFALVPRALRLRILARDSNRCQLGYQGCTVHATEVDHKINVARLGVSRAVAVDPANLQSVCRECHARKTNRERAPAVAAANRRRAAARRARLRVAVQPHPGD